MFYYKIVGYQVESTVLILSVVMVTLSSADSGHHWSDLSQSLAPHILQSEDTGPTLSDEHHTTGYHCLWSPPTITLRDRFSNLIDLLE